MRHNNQFAKNNPPIGGKFGAGYRIHGGTNTLYYTVGSRASTHELMKMEDRYTRLDECCL